jgi:folate-binding protein YgfZ
VMTARSYAILDARGVVRLAGADVRAFLQGLVSNDVAEVGPGRAVYAAMLTPQGKYLHDFLVFALGDALALDCERARIDDLIRRLNMYRLRARIEIADVSDAYVVAALMEEAAPGLDADGAVFPDPRLAALGWRAVLPREGAGARLEAAGFTPAGADAYDALRLSLGVPDGSRDIMVDKSFLLESNFEELNGVDFAKGCYVGQENTARQKHRGTVKKRLMPVAIDGPAPEPGTPILLDGRDAGTMRSSADGKGIALLRLEAVESKEPLVAGEARLTPVEPGWARA